MVVCKGKVQETAKLVRGERGLLFCFDFFLKLRCISVVS